MSESMLERVARALYEATPFTQTEGGFDDQSERYKRMCRVLARAALEATREPTDGMVDAGVGADFGRYLGERVANSHRAMIDAAPEGK